jgi:hypothetical protein
VPKIKSKYQNKLMRSKNYHRSRGGSSRRPSPKVRLRLFTGCSPSPTGPRRDGEATSSVGRRRERKRYRGEDRGEREKERKKERKVEREKEKERERETEKRWRER